MADQQAELPAAPTGPEATVQFGEFECWLQARYPLEPDAGYHEWLKASCGDCQETGGIHKLSALSSNDVGWRHVSLATVLKKVLNYMEAKQWSGNMAPIQVFPLAGGQLFGYITGHQRMVALHMLCVWFYMQSKTLPAWVKTMAQQVHFSVVVTSPETAAVHSLAGRLSEKLHATKWSYISICMMVNAKGMKLDDFRAQLLKQCSEAENQIDVKAVCTVASRVGKKSLQLLQKFQDERLDGANALPLSFWRGHGLQYLMPSQVRKSSGSSVASKISVNKKHWHKQRALQNLALARPQSNETNKRMIEHEH